MPPRSLSGPGCVVRLAPLLLGAACALVRPGPPAWLPELVERAEQARGLGFTAPVRLRLLSRAALPVQLERELEHLYPGDVLDRTERAGIAIGLLPAATRLRPAFLTLMGDVAVGFFSPTTRTVFLVTADSGRRPLGPEDQRVVLHELVHGLQAEHAPLSDLLAGLWDESDLGFALGATLEGDATWAEERDAAARGEAVRSPEEVAADFHPDWIAARHPDVPRAVREPLVLQYALGYRLARRAGEADGASALDRLLADPPLSSEQVLHPERAFTDGVRDAPTVVRLPERGVAPEGCGEVHRDPLGELGLRLWLSERGASEDEAARAAEGWDGDRLLVFACADGDGFLWWLRFDAAAEAEEFAASVRHRLADLPADRRLRGPPRLGNEGRAVWLSAGLDDEAPALLAPRIELTEARDLGAFLVLRPGLEARVAAWQEWFRR